MSSESRPQQPGQVSNLPGLTTYITGHDPETGKAIVQYTCPGNWSSYDDKPIGFNVAYTTSQFPASLNNDADLHAHDALAATKKLGLVNPGGTVCRIVDFAPGFDCMMHRTQSLDYGIVLEGSIELVLDSGETQVMHRGDVAVQRATMHAWRNPSKDNWARMVFVLQDCKKVVLGDKELKEDLGRGVAGLPSSGNDKECLEISWFQLLDSMESGCRFRNFCVVLFHTIKENNVREQQYKTFWPMSQDRDIIDRADILKDWVK